MSTGADAKTMPVTAEYEEGYERTFGAGSKERGTWVWDEKQQKLVRPWEKSEPDQALAIHAPISTDRYYENTVAIDGKTDIGSRRRYKEYLKQTGYCHASDFSQETIEKNREKPNQELRRELKETAERVMYERWKP